MSCGERVRKIRKEKELTLEKFGEKVGVTKQTVSRIENGVNSLTEQMLLSICREFGVNEEWLRTGEGEMFVEIDKDLALMDWAGSVLGSSDSSFKKRFVKMLSELDEQDWETLEKMALKLHSKKD